MLRVAMRGVLISLTLAGAGLVADPAAAVTCAMSTKPATLVQVPGGVTTNSTRCEIGTEGVDSAGQVNAESMFDLTGWEFLSRNNTDAVLGTPDEVLVPISMRIMGDALKGTLYLASDIWSRYSDLFLVLKAGGKTSNLQGFVSFLLTPNTFSWAYSTPYRNKNGAEQNISHFTVYGRKVPDVPPPPPPPPPPRPSPVPVPFGGLLLVSALAGLAVIRGRRAAA